MKFTLGLLARRPAVHRWWPPLRAAAQSVALLILLAGPWVGLSSPAEAQQGDEAPPSAEGAARKLVVNLIAKLPARSTLVVRPLAEGHTGLPESVAKRLETLIVNALVAGLPQDLNVTLLTGRDVVQIFRSLDESSFAGSSEELLESVLRAARAESVLACEPINAALASLEIQCSIAYGKVVCPGGGEIGSCATVDVKDVRNLGSAVVSFRWRNPEEYLEYVFTGLAWKLVGAVGLDESDAVELVGECPDDRSALTRFVTKKLRGEMRRAQRQRIGLRKIGGEGRRFELQWSLMKWGNDKYELSAELNLQGADGVTFQAGESTRFEVTSLPRNVRLVPCGAPDPDPDAETDLSGESEDGSTPPPLACGEDVKQVVVQPDRITLADWVLFARRRLERGDFVNLMVEAKRHLRENCEWRPLNEVVEAAVSGIAGELRVAIETAPREGLERLAEVEASAGSQPALLFLKARGHEQLGNHSAAEEAYVEWLDAAPQEHGERGEIVAALYKVRSLMNAAAAEESLLTAGDRTWVRWALTGKRASEPSEEGDGFDARARELIRTWQTEQGFKPTGYLMKRGELDALIAKGRGVRENEKFSELLGRALSPDIVDEETGWTDLHFAALLNLPRIAEALIDAGMSPNTPLAAQHVPFGDTLKQAMNTVGHGDELENWEADGETPLMIAVVANARETAELLLARGADVAAKSDGGVTPLHLAAEGDAHETAELLLDRGAAVGARDGDGSTPLHFAARGKAPGIAELLLARGAEVGAKDEDGRTALQVAVEAEAHEVEAVLNRHLDDAAFARAGSLNTASSYEAYLGSYATGLHAREARELLAAAKEREADHAAFARASREDTVASYDAYLASYSEGLHVAEARELRAEAEEREADHAAFARAKGEDTVASYDAYLASYPEGLHAGEARELRAATKEREADRAAFARAKGEDTVASYDAYLGLRPEGLHASEARSLRVAAKAREEDDAAFADAKRRDTVSGYDRYLGAHASGRHVEEARRLREVAFRREDDAAFVRAKRLDTVAAHDEYLRLYSGGRHVAEARALRGAAAIREADAVAFSRARSTDTVAGYDEYLGSFPGGAHATEARQLRETARRSEDTAAFSGAKGRDTAAAYDEYLGSYPSGLHAEEARRLEAVARAREADAAAFAEAKSLDTIAGYDGYLGSYPQGRHAVEARRLRAAAKFRAEDAAAFAHAKRLDTVADYDEYLGTYPGGHHVTEARRLRAVVAAREADDAAFAEAKRKDAVAGYDAYLGSFSKGRHVDEVRRLRAAASKVKRIGRVFRDCDHCPELVVVPPGTYLMGSPESEEGRDEDEGPRHRVVVKEAFAIGTTEVTRGEYARFVRETGLSGNDSCRTYGGERWDQRSGRDWRDPGYHQTDLHPAVCVNWDEAHRYVAWLSRETGREYRLPSESEWEYAARGGTDTSRHWGAGIQCQYANGADVTLKARHRDRKKDIVSCRDLYVYTSPVKQFAQNKFGLFDLLGNVWEWTADCGNQSYGEAPGDGSGWMRGECGLRVIRGGSWYSEPSSLRSANRLLNEVVLRNGNVGFRVARTLTSTERPTHDAEAAIAAADDETNTRASTRDTVEAYDEYLALYPNGRYAETARSSRGRAFGRLPSGGTFRDCVDCPEMVVLPPGSFAMGSPPDEEGRYGNEDPVREVALGESFAVGVREVTRGQYAAFVRESGYAGGSSCWVYEEGEWKERAARGWRDPGYGQTGDHPVVCVSWTDALAYVEWLSRKTGAAYRLPSEAEWEYAARGGTPMSRHWGDDSSDQCLYANGADQAAKRREAGWTLVASCDDGYLATSPVGRFEANAFGLRDALGNAWEWTRDCWNESHRSAPGDGRARERGDCSRRVRRGGSWSSFPRFLRSASRYWNGFDRRVSDVGFRVARELPWGADDGAFQRARNEGTVAAYEGYLRAHPEGRHVSEVKRLLAGPKDGEMFRDCADCPELVVVPAGTFVMGSPADEAERDGDEGPEHPVNLKKRFAVGVHEVTFEEWDACATQGGCDGYRPRDKGWGRGTRPVVFVSWEDARAYAGWLSRRTGKDYRLLTESEWEYVARAGKRTRTRYAWGNELGSGRANCESCGSRWDDVSTAPVGSFPSNAFGVHDMHGNVSEWVDDCWSPGYAEAPADGTAFDSAKCKKRVLRGGAWNDKPRYLRSANRSRSDPGTRSAPNFGFRVARALP